jgi:hypothetical protein
MPCRFEYGEDFIRDTFQILFDPPPPTHFFLSVNTLPPSFHSLVTNAINNPCLRDGVGCSSRTNKMCGISVIYVREGGISVTNNTGASTNVFTLLFVGGCSCFLLAIASNEAHPIITGLHKGAGLRLRKVLHQ